MKIAHLAEAFNLPVTSHGAHDVTVHLLAACPNRSYLEAHGFGLDRYIAEPLRIEEGFALAPDRPGHGIAFDWAGLDDRAEGLTMTERFDHIVVGGGSSGCVAAARLVRRGARVLLLEAGHSHRHPLLDMPPGIFKMINGSKFMRYHTPCRRSIWTAACTTSRRPTCSAAAPR